MPTHDEVAKRRVYATVVALLVVLLVGLTVADRGRTPFWGPLYPALTAYAAGLLVVVLRRERTALRTIELLVISPVILVLLGFLLTWRLAPTQVSDATVDLLLVMLWVGISFPLAFVVLGRERGLQLSLAVYGAFLVLIVPPTITGDLPGGASVTKATLSLAFFFAVTIAVLSVMASRLEELVAARTQAAVFATQAHADPLTGLANLRRLDDELERHLALAQRHGHPLSIVIADVDRFKRVNDRFGHDVGDDVLVEIAARLAATVRSSDVVGRWGGEEFLLLLPHTARADACELAERCREVLAATPFTGVGHLTASFGVATRAVEDDARSLLRRGDLALYAAKHAGRDRVVGLPALDAVAPDAVVPVSGPAAPRS